MNVMRTCLLTLNLVAADVRRLILFRLKQVGASLRRLLHFRGSIRGKWFRKNLILGLLVALLSGCKSTERTSVNAQYDLVIRHGTIYDGSGKEPFVGDLAINGDTIAAVGELPNARGRTEIDVRGLAVAPGFINMLSWATESLIHDGRSQSDIRQGVTLEIFGEGESMGPLNDAMKKDMVDQQADIKYEIKWTTLSEYLDYVVRKGISCNVGSF